MTNLALHTSAYDQRVDLTTVTIRQHSKLDEKAAKQLAVEVLRALDHIPEKMR